jgi:uncharacterized protein YjiS (DUF1127 family)
MSTSIPPARSRALAIASKSATYKSLTYKSVTYKSAEIPHLLDPATAPAFDPLGVIPERLLRVLDRAARLRPAKAVPEFMVAFWRHYRDWQMRRAVRVLLESLDDHALRDIGLARRSAAAEIDALKWRSQSDAWR